nr:MAG TPA: Chromatin remodeling complex ATPase [Caudoviricetes sp.]
METSPISVYALRVVYLVNYVIGKGRRLINMDYTFKTKPFKHQLDALSMSACRKNFAYFMEMGCVDEETEFLSNRGWVRFGDFDLKNWERPLLVAQAENINGDANQWAFRFVEPTAFIKKQGYEWVYLRGGVKVNDVRKTSELLLTSDHILPIKYTYQGTYDDRMDEKIDGLDFTAARIAKMARKDPDREFFPMEMKGRPDSQKTHIAFIDFATGGLRGFESEYFVPDDELRTLNEWELRFMVAVIADGTYPNKTNNKVDFYFMKDRKAERLRYIAGRAGIPLAYECKVGRSGKNIHIFHAIAPMKCKIFDERWYTLPQKALETVTQECFYWDGWISEQECQFFTVHRDSADFIQYALFASGWASRINYNGIKKLYTVKASLRRSYRPGMIPDFLVAKEPIYKNRINKICSAEEDDMVRDAYCFRVPSGYLVLRRRNRIFISGNSGKTKVMIDNIGVLHQKGQISGALILAPKGVYRNWSEKEIPTHLPDSINREILVWDAAASAGRKRALDKQIQNWDGKTLQFLVFNIESLVSEKGRKLIEVFIKKHNGNVLALVDESTCIKNHKAKRTKAAIALAAKCKARRIATGSPITNSPLDLFSQCAFLDKALLGFGSFYSFKNTYASIERVANRQGQHYEKILFYKNLDNLSEKLDKFSFRVTKKECLDLPEKIYMTRDVELTDEQRRAYKDMADHQFAMMINGDEVAEMSTSVVLTKFLRLHQILCGSFTSDDGELIRLPNKRVEALQEVLDEARGKVIIWATYLADIQAIEEMLKKEYGEESYVTYYGATSSEDRTKAIDLFQDESSPVRFFLGNVQTAGRGITLTAADTVVYYSNNFSLELRQQSEDRAHRLGQKNNVTYIDLVVRNSLDEKILKSLIEKRNIANEVLKDDLEEWISL